MTQDVSASANQQWVCRWLVLRRNRLQPDLGERLHSTAPWCWVYLQHGLDQTPLPPKRVWHAPWWKNFPRTEFFFFKDWTNPSVSRLLKTHCLSSQPHRGSLHHWILSDNKKLPMSQELQASAGEFSLRIKKIRVWLSLAGLKKEREGGAGRQYCWGRRWDLGTIHSLGRLLSLQKQIAARMQGGVRNEMPLSTLC